MKKIPFYKSPIIMVGISLFVILVLATFYRIYIALETHPGLTVEDPYKQGQQYAKTLAQKKKLQKMGWHLTLNLPKNLKSKVVQKYMAKLLKNNQVLNSDYAMLFFYRPASKKADFQVKMKKHNTLYYADVLVPLKGRWDVSVKVIKNKHTIYTSEESFYQ